MEVSLLVAHLISNLALMAHLRGSCDTVFVSDVF